MSPSAALPETLLQLAGVVLPRPAFARSVVLIIDAQREYRDGGLPLIGLEDAVGELARLLARARAAGAPVVHIVHHGKPGGRLFAPESPLTDILPEAVPTNGEPVVVKSLPNAFAATDLGAVLAGFGRKELIVAGFMTHNCVSATVRAALDLGYRSTVVAAATATRHLPGPLGGVVPAAMLQSACLAGLADRTATVVRGAADLLD